MLYGSENCAMEKRRCLWSRGDKAYRKVMKGEDDEKDIYYSVGCDAGPELHCGGDAG